MEAGGLAVHRIQVKNTFIEDPWNGEDDGEMDTILNKMDAKRQVSEPPPSISKLLEAHSNLKTMTFQVEKIERPEARKDVDSDSPTESSEPERESDCCSDESARQGTGRKQTPSSAFTVAAKPAGIPSTQPAMMMPPMETPSIDKIIQEHMATMSKNGGLCSMSNIPRAWADVQTIMMRNLPNKIDQTALRSMIDTAGFVNMYDFMYLPIDSDTDANRGYAFINFISPNLAFLCKLIFEGKRFGNSNSHKIVSVVPATLQGFEANYAHYSHTRITQGDPAARPLFFRQPLTSTRTQRGGRNKTQSLIDMAVKQLHQQERQLQEQKQYDFGRLQDQLAGRDRASRKAASQAFEPEVTSTPAIAKFCPYCGGSVKTDYKFCQYCGNSVCFEG